ncbi:glutathione S-transferase omega-1-like [Pelobates cultripes]|uniref:Glutathione S-transferase omega n=1 Tax=Pelobates cultripes TaxID=61616 RepID=A0AAD1TEB2_PELCU|nr:glutathione S-transferase omega-1-like [Pelobates cultripes]CAH2322425.1 glutathione S-transferase omega-1-like [Pelobates cultripes]
MTGSQKSLGKGSPAPGPVPEGNLRLYSMRFCPFAQRARLVLSAKGIKHEVININLKSKPDWFLEKVPSGCVPAVELSNGVVIFESPIVCDFLDEAYPGKKLTPADPIKKAKEKMILEFYNGVTTLLYKIFGAQQEKKDVAELKTELLSKLQKLQQILIKKKTPYFGGESLTMIDYMLYPWFERFVVFGVEDIFSQTPELKKWYNLMLKDPAVKGTFTPPEVLQEFFKLYVQGNINAVDYGL